MEYYIYQITCVPTGKSYVGQTQQFKTKDNKPYKYGIVGRWCDHVSSSKRSNAPLHNAIREHGADAFTQTLLETVTEQAVDVREAHWITTLKTTVPNGYNVMEHSRCKHREVTDIVNLYPDARAIEVKYIQKDGANRLVYVYIDTSAGRKRLTFGQGKEDTFASALTEATKIVESFQIKGVKVLSSDKRAPFLNQRLRRIRLVPFHQTMVAVYITNAEGTQTRICFGGKHVTFEDSVFQAKEFIQGMTTDKLENNIESRQQVAPCSVEAKPE